MLIQDMTHEASIALLKSNPVGHIACVAAMQPYITPFSFAYDGKHIYSFGTLGKKLTFMRTNPLVCLQVEKIISRQEWKSVVISGRFEELPDTPGGAGLANFAHDLVAVTPVWWEPGYTRTVQGHGYRPLDVVWFRVSIDEMTGHEAIPDSAIASDGKKQSSARHFLSTKLHAWANVIEPMSDAR